MGYATADYGKPLIARSKKGVAMAQELQVKIYNRANLDKYVNVRERETKIGQAIRVLESSQPSSLTKGLNDAHNSGARYAIILIPEDIGSRGNCGQPGADQAPDSFLKYFLNMQSNRYLNCNKVVIVGEVVVDDLMRNSKSKEGEDLAYLRELCAQLDDRVAPVIREIAVAGLEPIVIGGANNNSFPIIEGVVEALRIKEPDSSLSVVNCDPHADFRPMEGRHSGNPFSYANDRGYLENYCVFGLHENYNSEESLARLEQHDFKAIIYEDFTFRQKKTFDESLEEAHHCAVIERLPVGCEVDLDSIKDMPSSARTPFGISEEQAAHFVQAIASKTNCRYLHLSEGAPGLSADDGARRVGKCLALLVVTYIKAREEFREFW
jgi:formiminoglutamase